MYDETITRVRTGGGITSEFPLSLQFCINDQTLSSCIFPLEMNKLTKQIQEEVPQCTLFADDIILVDETRLGVKLEIWLNALKSKDFWLRTKIKFHRM